MTKIVMNKMNKMTTTEHKQLMWLTELRNDWNALDTMGTIGHE